MLGAHGIMFVYDVTNRETFKAIHMWMAEIEKYAVAGVSKVLVGNKSDMEGDRQVTYAEGESLAKEFGIKFLESSAKNSKNVAEAFQAMAGEMLVRVQKKKPAISTPTPTTTPARDHFSKSN